MKSERFRSLFIFAPMICAALVPGRALAQEPEIDRPLEMHAQATYLRQSKPSFPSPYSGPKSLGAARAGSYSFTATMYLGARLADGFEAYLNPEVTQGVPFSQLQGTAGFTNGELARTSGPEPNMYLARAFLRKTWNIGGGVEQQSSDQNQVATRRAAERIVLTAGTVSVLDVFDAVDYSRDAAALQERVIAGGAPFLGICVGMQLLATRGLEFGETPGLDWIAGVCRPLERRDPWIRIPHMGWNEARVVRAHPVFDALAPASHMYFIYSFVHQPSDSADLLAITDYGGPLAAAVVRNNLAGVQFHPEKSQAVGLAILGNFLRWRP